VPLQTDIAVRLASVRERIATAAAVSGRNADSVRLIAVSKTFGIEHVQAAIACGQRDFGENRVQEALQKMGASADVQITWHLIGHLQGNKARKAAGAFHWIHSIDSVDVLDRLDKAAGEAGTTPRVLVQVDLAREPTKHGATSDTLAEIFDRAARCTAVQVEGLMLLPPFFDDAEQARPFFRRLREVQQSLIDAGVARPLVRELSMGMSHDFDVAVQEGSTMVRVGTAIFGTRHV
jgi:pyridoxal phosphate enzyme (YggS family)